MPLFSDVPVVGMSSRAFIDKIKKAACMGKSLFLCVLWNADLRGFDGFSRILSV
ncbi:MAG: hypothetical protein FWG87_10360 [Defluviitaleaceae bacterium]|nr:hypothetical protein [Defluviitaleaceae bacterium]